MSEGLWNRRGSRPAHITKVSRIMDDRELTDLLEAGSRRLAGFTAPAKGLCLMKVDYE